MADGAADGGIGARLRRRGIMLILSSPSGAGKSTIARHLLEDRDLHLSVSVTTRQQRGSEIDGRHYHFITQREFERQRDSDALLEWAEVHGHFYGSPRDPVDAALQRGQDMLFDIDWQGGQQLMDRCRGDVVSIFILPPTLGDLEQRLRRRAEDKPEVIERRLVNARGEIPHWRDYDYVVVNDALQRAVAQVASILAGERLRVDRRVHGLLDFEKELLG